MLLAIGLIAGAIALGAVIYLTVKLTKSFLKKYRHKKTSKILAANAKDLVKEAVKNGKIMSLDDLDDDDVILAEYDEENDELVQDISISKDTEDSVADILKNNGGIVVFE